MKTTRPYHSIKQRRPKAVLIHLEAADASAVWLPLHRIDLDEAAGTVACTETLWAEKDAERTRDWRAEKEAERKAQREAGDKMVSLEGASLTESGKAIFVEGHVDEEVTDIEARRRFFFPLSMCQQADDGTYQAPAWLVQAKAAEVVYEYVSSRGRKGIDHLHGTHWQAHIAGHIIETTMAMLKKAEGKT
jgi:hypothetical protein